MKRLIKRAGTWWDPQLPGARSESGEFAVVQNNQVLICNEAGNTLRTLTFFQLNLKGKSSEEQIKQATLSALSFYLNEYNN